MKGYIDGDLGRISIDSEVIARYAGSTAVECFGIVGMAAVSMKDGLFKLLKGDSLTRGINVKIDEDNKISIEFHVIVSYGVFLQWQTILLRMLNTKFTSLPDLRLRRLIYMLKV